MAASAFSRVCQSFASIDEYPVPSIVPDAVRQWIPASFTARPITKGPYPLVHLFQWAKVVSVVKAVNEARLAWGFPVSSSTSRVWTVLRHAPLALFFVPRGDLSKYKIVKPLAFVQNHWTHISMGVQLVASIALFAAGDYVHGGGAIIGLTCQIVQEFDAVPQELKTLIAIVESVATNLIFYGPTIVGLSLDIEWATSLGIFLYSVNSTIAAEGEKFPRPNIETEPVLEIEQLRHEAVVYNYKADLKQMWEDTFGLYKDEVKAMVKSIDGSMTRDRPYLELAALLLVLKGVDVESEPLKAKSSAKEQCAELLTSVVKDLSKSTYGEDECAKVAWLLAYRFTDLEKIGYSYTWEQVMGSLEEQLSALWKPPIGDDIVEGVAVGFLESFDLYALPRPTFGPDDSAEDRQRLRQEMEVIRDDRRDRNLVRLIKAGILVQQKKVVEPVEGTQESGEKAKPLSGQNNAEDGEAKKGEEPKNQGNINDINSFNNIIESDGDSSGSDDESNHFTIEELSDDD